MQPAFYCVVYTTLDPEADFHIKGWKVTLLLRHVSSPVPHQQHVSNDTEDFYMTHWIRASAEMGAYISDSIHTST